MRNTHYSIISKIFLHIYIWNWYIWKDIYEIVHTIATTYNIEWTLHCWREFALTRNNEWWTINWNNDNVKLYKKRYNSFHYLLLINFKNVAWWFFFIQITKFEVSHITVMNHLDIFFYSIFYFYTYVCN